MKTQFLYIMVLMALIIPLHGIEPDPPVKSQVISNPVIAQSLADACDIVRLMNELKWKDAKLKLNKSNQKLMIEQIDSKNKDWHGIGAYRGSEVDIKNKVVRHRFSYGTGRLSAHEIWITYTYNKDHFQKPSLQVLGW